MNGGQGGDVEGTWSASLEWLVTHLASRFRELAFAEVRYRIKSWKRLDWCVEDAHAAIDSVGARRTLLLGFSMGGAVAAQTADAPSVETVIGLAPWLPERSRSTGCADAGSRFCRDRSIGRCPGSPASRRRARAAASSAHVRSASKATTRSFPAPSTELRVRARHGRPLPLPRAHTWARLVADELARFQSA